MGIPSGTAIAREGSGHQITIAYLNGSWKAVEGQAEATLDPIEIGSVEDLFTEGWAASKKWKFTLIIPLDYA